MVTASDDYDRIRDVLDRAGYTDEKIVRLMGVDLSRLGERKLPPLLRRTSGGTPLETLVRLFILDQDVDAAAAQSALAPMTLESWMAAGLLELTGVGQYRACVQLRCYQGLILAYDFTRRGRGGVRSDFVMSVSPSTLVLLGLTVRRRNRAALDLGSGCGIHALIAAGHSDRAVGVDVNPRALAISRFNAGLNRISNVEFRDGDMFKAVEGEAFDLIVSNPPFIIQPESRHIFLNSGTDDDDICRRLANDAPPFLNEGGICIFNANWAVLDGQEWKVRLAGWFEGSGCDVLVIGQGIVDIDEYAAGLIEVGADEQAEFVRLFDRWMDYYAARKIVSIGRGVIVMRKAGGRPNWFDVIEGPAELTFPSGDDVAQLVELHTFVHGLRDDRDLLDVRLRLAANVRFEQTSQAANGTWTQLSGRLRRVNGLGFSGAADATTAALVARYDGQRAVREHLTELAAAANTSVASIEPAALAIIKRLVEQGFLVPVDLVRPFD